MERPPRLADRRAAQSAPSPAGREPGEAESTSQSTYGGEGLRLWHVSVTFSGRAVEPAELAEALGKLVESQPFLASVRYAPERAEISYWDEAEDVDDAAAMGLRLWAEHRRVAGLPDWRPVGLEVLDRETYHARGQRLPAPSGLGDVRPW